MIRRLFLFLALTSLTGGCGALGSTGRLLTYTVTPYSTDFNGTPVGSKRCYVAEHKVKEPVSGYGITAEWSAATIAKAARKAGITNICYTEIETLSILGGTYRRLRLVVHGN